LFSRNSVPLYVSFHFMHMVHFYIVCLTFISSRAGVTCYICLQVDFDIFFYMPILSCILLLGYVNFSLLYGYFQCLAGEQYQDVSDYHSEPYHYGSHYSNSGTVLHFLVRLPPFTQMFLDYQGKCSSNTISKWYTI